MPGNLAYRVYRLIWEVLDYLYPPYCGGCGQLGDRWCKQCAQNTLEIEPPICPVCGDHTVTYGPCPRCQSSRPLFTCLRSYTIFTGAIREAVHQLKYQHNRGIAEVLSRPMITSLEKLNWPIDLVTSVPLGLVRLKERGYNQATLLARPISLYFQVPFSSQALVRARETPSQVGLSVAERQENMKDAFQADRNMVGGKNILVVDDVATSGATLNACAQALINEGAGKVYGFSLARAVFTPDMRPDIA